MGIKIAGIDVSGLIKKEIGQNVLKDPAHVAVLTTFTLGTRTGNLTGGTERPSTDSTGKGFIDETKIESVKGTLVKDGETIVNLIGDSFTAVPKINDHILIESTLYVIKVLDRDPAAAMYICLCRTV